MIWFKKTSSSSKANQNKSRNMPNDIGRLGSSLMLYLSNLFVGYRPKNIYIYIYIFLYYYWVFHTINYNIENWVWSLGSHSRHSVLHAVRLLHHRRTVSSSGGSPQQTCHSADIEVQQSLWYRPYSSNHPTVLASR